VQSANATEPYLQAVMHMKYSRFAPAPDGNGSLRRGP
jgi:hypothetical protein